MSHWDVARFAMYGGAMGLIAFAGWTLGGLIY